MLNIVALNGRLTADPELRHTQNDVAVTSFTLAVDRNYSKGNEKQTDFISIVAWRGTAEFAAKYFRKGQLVAVTGSIQTRKYTDKSGNNRTAFEVVALQVDFAESKRNTQSNMSAPAENEQEEKQQENDNSANGSDFVEIDGDDDLPF